MFNGTTATLIETTGELCIRREVTLATLLERYLSTLEQPQENPDHALLDKALHIFEQHRLAHALDGELAHLGVILYYHLQDYQTLFELLEEYRQQPLPLYEQAWAWWYCVDCLALLGKHASTVESQQALLSWALLHFPLEHCLFVCNDSTQAFSWLMVEKADQWLVCAQDLLQAVQPTPASRNDRFLLLRSMINVLTRLNRREDAHRYLAHLRAIEQEDSQDIELHLETTALQIQVLELENQSHLSTIRDLAQDAIQQVQHLRTQFPCPTTLQRRTIRRLAHNIGSSLYMARQYDIAIPLFEIAIEYGSTSPHSYLWLAASLYALSSSQACNRVTHLVHQARERDGSPSFLTTIQRIPEFDAAIRNQMSVFHAIVLER